MVVKIFIRGRWTDRPKIPIPKLWARAMTRAAGARVHQPEEQRARSRLFSEPLWPRLQSPWRLKAGSP
jgi:hypothetical protein